MRQNVCPEFWRITFDSGAFSSELHLTLLHQSIWYFLGYSPHPPPPPPPGCTGIKYSLIKASLHIMFITEILISFWKLQFVLLHVVFNKLNTILQYQHMTNTTYFLVLLISPSFW